MKEVVVALGAYLVGCLTAGAVLGSIFRRWADRIRLRDKLDRTTADLENRRRASDSGRTHKTRPSAGPPARIVDAMPARGTSSKTRKKKNPGNG